MSTPVTQNQIEAARQKLHDVVAKAAADQGLSPGDRFQLIAGAEYGVRELVGQMPAPNDHDRLMNSAQWFRGRDLVLNTQLA